jgi:hypothetical protein
MPYNPPAMGWFSRHAVLVHKMPRHMRWLYYLLLTAICVLIAYALLR